MNSFNEELTVFLHSLERRDWFCDAELDNFGKFIVYVDKMDIPFIGATPDKIGGHQVLFHYIASQPAHKEEPKVKVTTVEIVKAPVEENLFLKETNLADMVSEFDRLEKVCGTNILQDIFYEVHDGKNAITNLASRYPEVKESLEKLYDEYGFDLIYEELDG